MIGKRACLYVEPVLLKRQPFGFYKKLWTLFFKAKHCSTEWPGVAPWYAQVALGLYHFGNGDWKILPEITTANWLAMRDGKRSPYVIVIGVKS